MHLSILARENTVGALTSTTKERNTKTPGLKEQENVNRQTYWLSKPIRTKASTCHDMTPIESLTNFRSGIASHMQATAAFVDILEDSESLNPCFRDAAEGWICDQRMQTNVSLEVVNESCGHKNSGWSCLGARHRAW